MTFDTKTLDHKLTKSRVSLLANHPFFGALAYGLDIQWDDTINPPSACTNGEWIKFHPEFVSQLSDYEMTFVMAHEILHPALLHTSRANGREPKKWNVACDIVVNYLLQESKVGVMPEGLIHRPDIYMSAKGQVERIYDMIDMKDYPNDTDHVCSGDGSATDQEANWKNRLHQAMQQAKAIGNMPGSLEKFVEELTEVKVSWQDQLRAFIMTTRGADRTYAKRNRRHIANGLPLPGVEGYQMGEIVFAIDCSGSTSDQMVAQCGAELRSIQEELRPEKIHVVYWDTKIQKHEEFEPDDPLQVKVHGRGGTDVRCVWKFLEEQGIEPTHCVVATDLLLGGKAAFGNEPDFPVLWAVMESSEKYAPWGDVLEVK